MNRQPISSTNSPCLPYEEESAPALPERRELLAIVLASAGLYLMLAWLCWPSLSYAANALGDQAKLEIFRKLSAWSALTHVGGSFLRPGENLLFWLMAHSSTLLPWRALLLGVFLLTTGYLQYDATVRTRSQLDGLGAALAFSVNPTALSVVCWLSTANIAFGAAAIVVYVHCARLALDARVPDKRHVAAALVALVCALSFYELALFAPLAVLAYQRLFTPKVTLRAARWLHGGAALCVTLYLAIQIRIAHALSFWEHESVPALAASSMRYAMRNYYLWFNPFDSFGVLIPEAQADHTLENVVCWLLIASGFGLVWIYRKTDPLVAFGGLWFSIFLLPVGTFLHFEGSPVALHHMYLPTLGVAAGAVRLFTRYLERVITSIRFKTVRLVFETVLSLVLLWSLAPLVAECRRTVEHWSDAEQLYLTTLKNYPQSSSALSGLAQTLATHGPQEPQVTETVPGVWQRLVDMCLLRPAPEPAAKLLEQGTALLQQARFTEAGSALARAFVASTTRHEQLDAGRALAQALLQAELQAPASMLLARLRQSHPELGRETP